jgi:hypothetical protein
MSITTDVLTTARWYHSLGFCVLPIPARTKAPAIKGWKTLRLTEAELPEAFPPGSNIGLVLGDASGGLVDVDLDCPEALELADEYLPPTLCITGRAGKPRSHYWYMAPGGRSRQFRANKKEMLVELRSTGSQTVVGPSIHPDGDPYETLQDKPSTVPYDELLAAVQAMAGEIRRRRGEPPNQEDQLAASPSPAKSMSQAMADVAASGGFTEASAVIKRASNYLSKMPEAVSGSGGHNALFAAARAVVWGFGIEPATAFEMLRSEYNPRCKPSWKDGDLLRKVNESLTRPFNKPFGYLRDATPSLTLAPANAAEIIRMPPPDASDGTDPAAAGGAPDFSIELPEAEAPHTPAVDPGPLPPSLLRVPGFIDEVMDYTLANAPYPEPVLAFCGALALQAVLAGRKVRDPKDNRTAVYLLGLANTGTGKDFPRKVNQRILAEVGMASAVADSFASGEGLEDRMYINPAMLFQTDEIDTLMQAISGYGNKRDPRYEMIMQVMLKFYTSANADYAMRTKANLEAPRTIEQPCLCLFGTAIPENFYEALSPKMLTNGFAPRMLVFEAGRRGVGQDVDVRELPSSILKRARWWTELDSAAGSPKTKGHAPRIVEPTPEARSRQSAIRLLADAAYAEAESKSDQAGMAMWSRANEKAHRLALIYACSASARKLVITVEAVEWAWAVVSHQTRRMLFKAGQHVSASDFDGKCKAMLRVIRECQSKGLGEGWVPFWQLSRRLPWTPKEHDEVRQALLDQARIDFEEIKTGGTRRRLYRLRTGGGAA